MKGKLILEVAKRYLKLYWKPLIVSAIAGAAIAELADASEDVGIKKGVHKMFEFINDAGLREQFDAYMAKNYPELCEKTK